MAQIESVLESTKKKLGLAKDYVAFDEDVLSHIGVAINTLEQLGVFAPGVHSVEDYDYTWEQLLNGDGRLNMVKSYIYLKVKTLFDPDQSGFLVTARNDQLKEIRKLAGRKWRDKLREFVAEGEDLLAAADAAGWVPLARLVAEGIEVLPIAGSELGTGRGGPRCMSCPVART